MAGFNNPGQTVPRGMMPGSRPQIFPAQNLRGHETAPLMPQGTVPPPRVLNPGTVQSSTNTGLIPTQPILAWGSGALGGAPFFPMGPVAGIPRGPPPLPGTNMSFRGNLRGPPPSVQPGVMPFPPEIMPGQRPFPGQGQQIYGHDPSSQQRDRSQRDALMEKERNQDRGQRSSRDSDRNERSDSRHRSSDRYREDTRSSSREIDRGRRSASSNVPQPEMSPNDRQTRGAILLDDRDPSYSDIRSDVDGRRGRSGAVLIEDREPDVENVVVKKSERGTLLIDDRGSDGLQGQRSRSDRGGYRSSNDSRRGYERSRTSESRQERLGRDDGRHEGRMGRSATEGRRGGTTSRNERSSRRQDLPEGRGSRTFSSDRDRMRDRLMERRSAVLRDDRDSDRESVSSLHSSRQYRGNSRDSSVRDRPHRAILREDRKSDCSDSDISERHGSRSRSISSSRHNEYTQVRSRDRGRDKGRYGRRGSGSSSSRSYADRGRDYRNDEGKSLNFSNKDTRYSDSQVQQGSSRSGLDTKSKDWQKDPTGMDGMKTERSDIVLSEGEITDLVLSDADIKNEDEDFVVDSTRKRPGSDDESVGNEKRRRTESPSKSSHEDEVVMETVLPSWTRSSPADLYFTRDTQTGGLVSTKKMQDLEDRFQYELIERGTRAKASMPVFEPPARSPHKVHFHHHHHHHHDHSDDSSSSCDSSSGSSGDDETEEEWLEELKRKQKHPHRLHPELWYNDPGEVNDGPLCRCSLKSRKSGIRHNVFPGEQPLPLCDLTGNLQDRLFHYRITFSPATNFLTKHPTIIEFDNHEYIFEGFSLFTHTKIPQIPQCTVVRFNIMYTIHLLEEKPPEAFSVRSLDLFTKFLFNEVLELVDIDWKGPGGDSSCQRTHLMPRFARSLPENGTEILSMNEVLSYLMTSGTSLIKEDDIPRLLELDKREWQTFVDDIRGVVVSHPGKKPSSIRIDQVDRDHERDADNKYPLIIHHGLRPAQLSYAGNPEYKKKWREYIKFRHLLNGWPKVSTLNKQKLKEKEDELQRIRVQSSMKREVTVEIGSEGFLRTGIRSDICQHAMMLPVLLGHLRFHDSLTFLEKEIAYQFKDRGLLQLALTHSSYKVNYGTNPDHVRNSISNCGSRLVEFGDQKVHYLRTRKKGLTVLMSIMSKMGQKVEKASEIPHNERLEFLGDAVVEFVSSTHLFYMFPWLDEGELTTYRGSMVQNQHLAILAKKLHLQDFMLYAHGPDLCHESDLKHAMANCFEAFMGALFIDGGIELADRLFSKTLFEEEDLLEIWTNLPKHPLQEDEPFGDRHWIESSPTLQKMLKLEDMIGVEFYHIRLLARSFSQRNVGYNNLTLGHNQRLEFLGDTIIQLISSEYLFKHFPEHHEGHLSLLRSSLVNNRTQSKVCDELGMQEFVITADKTSVAQAAAAASAAAATPGNVERETHMATVDLKMKDKADLLEAFLGALFVDHGLDFCKVLCEVCFFPRLEQFILNQGWSDPKSQLQQCCLTLREMNGEDPDIPIYKVIQKTGPTNTRRYHVAVYFRGKRLAMGVGHSIQQAEMEAASRALYERHDLFPILLHHRRFLQRNKAKWQLESGEISESSGSEMNPNMTSSPKQAHSREGRRAPGNFRKTRPSYGTRGARR